jgi:NAD(P)-dependent dehydrogenase (short-subunit alcohol dehydrogenase family)
VKEGGLSERALLVGNSDGIGLATTRRLHADGWEVHGVSRSESPIGDSGYSHTVADVTDKEYTRVLGDIVAGLQPDLCIYCAGIGELLDLGDMGAEARIIDVNLTGMVRTASVVIPAMLRRGRGHFIGLSSLADELLSPEAPSYHASKAGFSNYLESLALALKGKGVHVTNVRFGFVDTKMAKGDVKPLMMSVEKAVDHLQVCIAKRPVRYTAPRLAVPLIKFRKLMMTLAG